MFSVPITKEVIKIDNDGQKKVKTISYKIEFIDNMKFMVYPYEYMDNWDKFNETFLLDKKAFYSELYLENLTNEGYIDAQKVCEEFELKNLSKYNDLCLRKDVLFLVDVFEIFRKIFFRNL